MKDDYQGFLDSMTDEQYRNWREDDSDSWASLQEEMALDLENIPQEAHPSTQQVMEDDPFDCGATAKIRK